MTRTIRSAAIAAAAAAVALASPALAGVRDIQMVRVDFTTQVIEVRNLGASAQPLNGFRFCSNNSSVTARYTGVTGLNGRTLQPGESLFVHFNNDATPGATDAVNIAALGGVAALPLSPAPYGLGLYWTTPFTTGANQADYIQWTDRPNLSDPGNLSADLRATAAVAGGTWTAANAWIMTQIDSLRITLDDLTGAELHSPADYSVENPAAAPSPDINSDGVVNGTDLLILLNEFGGPGSADLNNDGTVNGTDLLILLNAFGASG